MNTPPGEHFFEITLSQQGAANILRTFKIVRSVFALTLLMCCCYIFVSWVRFIEYFDKYNTRGNITLFVQLRLEPLSLIVVSVLSVFQMIYYYRFMRLCKKGIDLRQSEFFSGSFIWLLKNTVIMCINIVISLAFALFHIYVEVEALIKSAFPI